MRKVKLDSKNEKAANVFSGNENLDKNAHLSFVGGTKILEIEKENNFTGERKSFIKLFKRIFLFLPGTFLLFFMSFGAAVIFLEIVVYRREIQTLPDDFPFQFGLIGLMILSGTLMTWFGLGDIKNRKHFVIPASLTATGALIGAIIKIAADFSGLADKILDDINYLIYLFPLALIVPVLAKGFVDRKTEEDFK